MTDNAAMIAGASVLELAQMNFIAPGVISACIANRCAVKGVQLTDDERADADAEIRRQLDILFNQHDFALVREGQDGN